MPTIAEIINVITGNPLAWSAFLALPIILICIACLMPRGEGRKAIHIERAVIASLIALILVVPALIAAISPDALGFTFQRYLIKDAFITGALLLEMATILWGIYSAKSYLTQAIYGMMTTILLPYGLILLVFPVWIEPSLATIFSDAFKNGQPLDLLRLIQYALIFFVPVWLIRSGEYKFRLSSIWHLFGGIAVGGSVGLLVLESMPSLHIRTFDLFIGAVKEIITEDTHFHRVGVEEWPVFKAVMFFILFAIITTFAVAGIVSVVRKIAKTGTRNFRSESLGGFIARFTGSLMAIIVSIITLVVLIVLVTPGTGAVVLFALPAIMYISISCVTLLLSDMIDIKHGIKRARAEEA